MTANQSQSARDQLTDQQAAAVALFGAGKSFAVEAGAGTGKTHTLRAMALTDPNRSGVYVAFNKAIVSDAQRRMPSNVRANTVHSMAHGAVGRDYSHRLRNSARMRPADLARRLGVDAMVVTYLGANKRLAPGYLASHVMKAVRIFCQTADREPRAKHFPYIDGIDHPDGERRTFANNNAVANALEPALRRAWADITNLNGELRFEHGHYLKMWQLGGAVVPCDYLMLDEAQDLSPVMLDIVRQQDHAQRVFVGDSQQAIYGFMGSVNAIEAALGEGYLTDTTYLTQSFRFGSAIAGAANYVLGMLGAELRLTGLPSIESTIGPVPAPDVLLTRSNGTALAELLTAQAEGRSVHITGGADDMVRFAKAVACLKAGEFVSHPELACFSSWAEVQDYAAQDPLGDELALLVKLVDEFGPDAIVAGIENMVGMRDADLVCSTAHKAKGLEWNTVRLGGDFPMPRPDKPFPTEELRLLYVAATRAKFRLDHLAVPLFHPGAPT